MLLKNVMLQNFIPFQFYLKTLKLTHENTFKMTSMRCNWSGAIIIVFLQLLQIDSEHQFNQYNCMFLSCHVRVLE